MNAKRIDVLMVRCVGAMGLAVAIAAATNASIVVGPEWDEQGDAGSLPGTAQTALGTGPLAQIRGTLTSTAFGGDQQDMYLINITAPTLIVGGGFSASTETAFGGSTDFNSALWLFDAFGLGLLGTTSTPVAAAFSGGPGVTMGNVATDGTGLMITTPGLYYLAISVADSEPFSVSGLPIFDFISTGEVSGPDGPGGSTPIMGWTTGSEGGGEYVIRLTGVSFVPTPAAAVMILGFGLGAPHRRRRA